MRKVALVLAFQLAIACGGRTLDELGDPPPAASGGTTAGGGAASGGHPSGTSGGAAPATGGRATSGGAPSFGGVLASGGLGSAGRGSISLGGGDGACRDIIQRPEPGSCVHVKLCPMVQHQTLCMLTSVSTASCFCYIDGKPTRATSEVRASEQALCEAATLMSCPAR